MSAGLPWFKFFPSDFMGGVVDLSASERGVYITLLCCIYDHGGSIPRDDDRLSRRCGLPKFGFVRALTALIEVGKIVQEDGCLSNPRAKIVLSERENLSFTRRKGAQITNNKKATKSTQQLTPTDPLSDPLSDRSEVATRARVPEARSQKPDSLPSATASGSSSGAPEEPQDDPPQQQAELFEFPSVRKKTPPVITDMQILDKITDIWNPWASVRGSPSVAMMTGQRAVHCRKRVEEMMAFFSTDCPEEAFKKTLSVCEDSFFVKGTPRTKLKFDQLMQEGFVAKLLEGQFKHEVQGQQQWRK